MSALDPRALDERETFAILDSLQNATEYNASFLLDQLKGLVDRNGLRFVPRWMLEQRPPHVNSMRISDTSFGAVVPFVRDPRNKSALSASCLTLAKEWSAPVFANGRLTKCYFLLELQIDSLEVRCETVDYLLQVLVVCMYVNMNYLKPGGTQATDNSTILMREPYARSVVLAAAGAEARVEPDAPVVPATTDRSLAQIADYLPEGHCMKRWLTSLARGMVEQGHKDRLKFVGNWDRSGLPRSLLTGGTLGSSRSALAEAGGGDSQVQLKRANDLRRMLGKPATTEFRYTCNSLKEYCGFLEPAGFGEETGRLTHAGKCACARACSAPLPTPNLDWTPGRSVLVAAKPELQYEEDTE